ncbi:Enkurin domain-containing protein 1 [Geodia barretti]|uniref:Enkurin domain-containing protein 1 n=1 Tax=Geodia barretti TaxID=519541 RepID=A0AA35U2T5_GEOBA|nr:Enkurin domain-containing protein 1 [Geodia barretti]
MAISFSPLSPDPGYEHTTVFYPKGRSRDPTPKGRLRPEGRAIAESHSQGTIARLLQEGGDFSRPPHARKPPQPKDHSRANRGRIRQLAERGRRKREEVDSSAPPLPSSSSAGKFSHVPSKVCSNLEPRPNTAQPPRSPPPPSSNQTTNHLAANIRAASAQSVRRGGVQQERLAQLQRKRDEDFSHHQKGKLPQYLVSRRLQWKKAEEERLANRPDPSVPPGHTLMSSKERRHTLDVLTQHQSVLTRELASLPLSTDTLKHRLKRAELENKLTEIEDALKIFSRPKVFVKSDV